MNRLTVSALCLVLAFGVSAAHAEDFKWGAIAVETKDAKKEPLYGVGGGETEKQAEDNALGFCAEAGGAECKVIVKYEQCGALTANGKGTFGWGVSPTKAGAEKEALAGCKEGDCSLVVSDCNTGE